MSSVQLRDQFADRRSVIDWATENGYSADEVQTMRSMSSKMMGYLISHDEAVRVNAAALSILAPTVTRRAIIARGLVARKSYNRDAPRLSKWEVSEKGARVIALYRALSARPA